MSTEEFKGGRHGGQLGYPYGAILAILNLCHYDAYHKVLAQFDWQFWRRCGLMNFKMAAIAALLDIGREWF